MTLKQLFPNNKIRFVNKILFGWSTVYFRSTLFHCTLLYCALRDVFETFNFVSTRQFCVILGSPMQLTVMFVYSVTIFTSNNINFCFHRAKTIRWIACRIVVFRRRYGCCCRSFSYEWNDARKTVDDRYKLVSIMWIWQIYFRIVHTIKNDISKIVCHSVIFSDYTWNVYRKRQPNSIIWLPESSLGSRFFCHSCSFPYRKGRLVDVGDTNVRAFVQFTSFTSNLCDKHLFLVSSSTLPFVIISLFGKLMITCSF